LKIKDVEVTDVYIIVNIPQTKTIYRPVPIPLATESVIQDPTFLDSALNAFTSLMQYLNAHPGYPGDMEYPLWYDEKKGRSHLDPYSLSGALKRLGKQEGIEKNVSACMLRRIAFNRFRGVNREMLCAGFGLRLERGMVSLPVANTRPPIATKSPTAATPGTINDMSSALRVKETPTMRIFWPIWPIKRNPFSLT
jgi:hypothetical protein